MSIKQYCSRVDILVWTGSPSNERSLRGSSLPQLEVIINAIHVALQLKLVKPGKLNHSSLSLEKGLLFKKESETADLLVLPISGPFTFSPPTLCLSCLEGAV